MLNGIFLSFPQVVKIEAAGGDGVLPNLKLLRKMHGISQQRLADAIHVSQPSINKYENHNVEPDLEILARMADYFNTSVDYIIGHTDVQRRIEHMEEYHLNQREAELITRFRSLNQEEQQCVDVVVQTLMNR